MMANRLLFGATGTAACLALTAGVSAQSSVGGPIFADDTWDLAGSPYIVESSVVIGADATLTIDPGVEVRVNTGLGIAIGSDGFGAGTLIAQGTALQPILFTSNVEAPDTPAAGDWNDIFFSTQSVDGIINVDGEYVSGCVLQHCIIEYAGGGSTNTGSITIENSSPFLANIEVRNSARSGVYARDMSSGPALNIVNSEFWECNTTSQNGAAIYINAGNGHSLSDLDIHDNSTNFNGGGLYVQNTTSASIEDSTFTNNSAGNGGGMYINNSTNFTATSLEFTGNSANSFGGFYFTGGGASFSQSTAQNNSANSNYGGGYFGSTNGTVNNVVIDSNSAGDQIGGIGLVANNIDMSNSQITNNTSNRNGGGIYANSAVEVTDCTIDGNEVIAGNGPGGGVFQAGGSGAVYMNNTITNNSSAQNGGGVYLNGTNHTFSGNTIFQNFALFDGGGVYVNSSNTTFTQNDVQFNEAEQNGGGFYWTQTGGSLAGNEDANTFNIIANNTADDGQAVFYTAGQGNDLNAQWACWGTVDAGEITASIHDFFDNSSLGFVLFVPFVDDENCAGDVQPCPEDIAGNDGVVGVSDLLALLGAWGADGPGADLAEPFDVVGIGDLLALLGAWGECP